MYNFFFIISLFVIYVVSELILSFINFFELFSKGLNGLVLMKIFFVYENAIQ